MRRLITSALILALVFGLAPDVRAAVLKQGDRGNRVVQLQNILISRGFLDGEADGVYGSATVEAIKRFQASVGLEADGVCGDQTFQMLNGSDQSDQTTGYAIKRGSRGDDVAELQNILIAMGFMSGKADGICGSGTVEAIKKFQASVGLTADGVAGEKTLDALSESARIFEETGGISSAPSEVQRDPVELEKSDEVSNVETTETFVEPKRDAVENTYAEIGSVIKRGMYGEGVTDVQKKLIAIGFMNGEADGVCGAQTVEAIKNFQASVGIEPDGVCGLMTYAALEDASYNTSDRTWEDVIDYERNYNRGRSIFVDATAYSAYDPGNGFYTACGSLVRHGIIAVDPNVIPLGTRVYIPGYGEAIADDVGGAIIGNRIDIAFDSHEEAMYFGRQYLEIFIIG